MKSENVYKSLRRGGEVSEYLLVSVIQLRSSRSDSYCKWTLYGNKNSDSGPYRDRLLPAYESTI